METTTYTALCERAGRWWVIHVPQVEGLTVQVRSLDQAEIIARQSIARALGIAPEGIHVDVLPNAPAPVAHALDARRAAREAVTVAAQATHDALDALAREGFPFHDAATMLGLSPAEIEHYGPAPAPNGQNGPSGPNGPRADESPLQLAGQ